MRWNSRGRTRSLSPRRTAGLLIEEMRRTEHALEGLEERKLLAVDLSYTELSVANNALPGGVIRVNSTVANNGDEAVTDDFEVKFFLSSDTTLDGGDVELGTFMNTVDIPAGGTRGFAADLTIPAMTVEGNWFVIGVADSGEVIGESNELNNRGAGQFFVGNMAPTITTPIVGPFTLERTSNLTILVLSAEDTDGITGTLTVDFWYDLDNDGVLSESADRLLGLGQSAPNTPSFVYEGRVPTYFRAGMNRIFARASDGLDSTTVAATFTLQAANQPIVQTLSITPGGTLPWGSTVTFTAGGVSDPDDAGTIDSVRLYRETNGMDGFQADDELVGVMVRDGMTDSWVFETTVDPAWGESADFYVQATDSMDRTGNVASTSVDFQPTTPATIDSLNGPASAVRRARPITLTAAGVSGNSQSVQFFRDSNRDGVFDPATDQLLGTSDIAGGSASIEFVIDPAWGAGQQRFFARAIDGFDLPGDAQEIGVSLIRNRVPRVLNLTADATRISKGNDLTLTANNIRDDDGLSAIDRVEFFRDSNRNGRFDAATDELIGTGTQDGNDWSLTFTVPGRFRNGNNTFFVKAYDIVGGRSATRSTVVRVTRNLRPTIGLFTVSPPARDVGQRITFLARDVGDNSRVSTVQFFLDSNDNGVLDFDTDLFIGRGGQVGEGRYRRRVVIPAEFGTGERRFFAVAFDNLGIRSAIRSDTVQINA